MSRERMVRIDDVDDPTAASSFCTLEQLLANNKGNEDVGQVRVMAVGESVVIGGGTAPAVRLTVLS